MAKTVLKFIQFITKQLAITTLVSKFKFVSNKFSSFIFMVTWLKNKLLRFWLEPGLRAVIRVVMATGFLVLLLLFFFQLFPKKHSVNKNLDISGLTGSALTALAARVSMTSLSSTAKNSHVLSLGVTEAANYGCHQEKAGSCGKRKHHDRRRLVR